MPENFIDTETEILKINLDLLLKSFDKLDPEARKVEFAKMAVASCIIKQVIESVKDLGPDGIREMLKNSDEFVRGVFSHIGMYNEIGLELGYTVKADQKDE